MSPDPYACAHCGARFPVPSLARDHERTCPQAPTPTGRVREPRPGRPVTGL